jgi:sec-independent protein translocase protein TatB
VFDIGFAEILLIGIVGLLVVGPEQLPGTVRTVMAWVNRFRRSFDQIRTEVRRELHNDEVMQKLREESREFEQKVRDTAQSVNTELEAIESLGGASAPNSTPDDADQHLGGTADPVADAENQSGKPPASA